MSVPQPSFLKLHSPVPYPRYAGNRNTVMPCTAARLYHLIGMREIGFVGSGKNGSAEWRIPMSIRRGMIGVLMLDQIHDDGVEAPLLRPDAIEALRRWVLPLARVVTPNLHRPPPNRPDYSHRGRDGRRRAGDRGDGTGGGGGEGGAARGRAARRAV